MDTMISITHKKAIGSGRASPGYELILSHVWKYSTDGCITTKVMTNIIRTECGYRKRDPVDIIVTNLTPRAVHWDECFRDNHTIY